MARDLRTVARMVNAEVATTLINRAYQPAIPMAENGPTMSGGLVIRYSERDLQPLVSFRRLAHSEDGIPLILRRALQLIEKLRSDNLLYDLFGDPTGSVSMLEIDGERFFGSNSRLPLYTSRDAAEAEALRDSSVAQVSRTIDEPT